MKQRTKWQALLGAGLLLTAAAQGSSHMDAPLITLDPAANTTDVYAFVTREGEQKSLTVALSVYPFQEPGIGPNNYRFDDNVLYQIHIVTGTNNLRGGQATIDYQFQFKTTYRNENTILQAYLGPINEVGDENQNMIQTYTVTKRTSNGNGRNARSHSQVLGNGIVPPNNEGFATPLYNLANSGNDFAKPGVAWPQISIPTPARPSCP